MGQLGRQQALLSGPVVKESQESLDSPVSAQGKLQAKTQLWENGSDDLLAGFKTKTACKLKGGSIETMSAGSFVSMQFYRSGIDISPSQNPGHTFLDLIFFKFAIKY